MKLTETLETEILEHAQAEDPRECCGLIAVVKGRRRYFRCQNIAATPSEHFVLSGEDYAQVEDQGEIVAVVHSHPISNPAPSQADRVACQKSGLPWVIVNPKTEAWGHCKPDGFELLYVDNFHREGFRRIPFEELKYGDALLMQLGSRLPNHAAIYIGDQQILHHIQGRLSSRDVLGSYYVKNTAMVLRHESR